MVSRITVSILLATVVLAPGAAGGPAAHADATPELTPPSWWLAHAEDDLARFWLDPRYHGDPVGAFPTFIGPDGCVWEPSAACTSMARAPEWIAPEIGRRYVRMVSRQVYTYGVIFHLTGDGEALALARAGARWIMETAWDRRTGSVVTWLAEPAGAAGAAFSVAPRPDPDPAARSTQSLAYALLGPGLLYYLTGDPALLEFVQSVKDHIFGAYWSDDLRMLRWARATEGAEHETRRELVSQLDQINAYLLLLTPLLGGDQRVQWEADLRRLGEVLWRDFHDPERHRFFGYLHEPAGRLWGQRHNDFGHTAKAYWMLVLSGRLLGEDGWVQRARAGLADVLEDALVRRHVDITPDWQRPVMMAAADPGGWYWVWSNRPDGDGIAWWEWCELDQAAATLALEDPRWTVALARTGPTWFAAMVDPASGAVLPYPGARDAPRAHHWMNGYHAAEHALVGYITTSLLRDEPWRLHYAPVSPEHPLHAHVFHHGADLHVQRRTVGTTSTGEPVVEATFTRR